MKEQLNTVIRGRHPSGLSPGTITRPLTGRPAPVPGYTVSRPKLNWERGSPDPGSGQLAPTVQTAGEQDSPE